MQFHPAGGFLRPAYIKNNIKKFRYMKTKSNGKSKKQAVSLPNPALDLFGEVPVLQSELEIWVAVVAPRWYQSRGMPGYIRDYDVPGKIRRWKLDGQFDEIKGRAAGLARCEGCIGRFGIG